MSELIFLGFQNIHVKLAQKHLIYSSRREENKLIQICLSAFGICCLLYLILKTTYKPVVLLILVINYMVQY